MKQKVKLFLETIKFEHTLFALPFAYLGLIQGEGGWPRPDKLFWVTLAMVGLRTVGMIANRLADVDIDRQNPRTSRWPLSMGLISKNFLTGIAIIALAIFFLAAHALGPLSFLLSPVPCAMIFIYPYLKRFTWLSHLFLGGILGLAPVGGWIASRGVIGLDPVPLSFAVLFWVAGFDILYALQDAEFDRRMGLFSIPANFGKTSSLWTAALFHILSIASLIWLGGMVHLGIFYWTGVALAALIMLGQHRQKLFFLPNASISIVLLAAFLIDRLFKG